MHEQLADAIREAVEVVDLPASLRFLICLPLISHVADTGAPAARVPRFPQTSADAGFKATSGQHLDLAAEGRHDLSAADALEIERQACARIIDQLAARGQDVTALQALSA